MTGSVRQRGPQNWAAIVYCGVDPKTGKRRYRWTSGFKTEKEARAHLALAASHPGIGAGVGPYGSARLRLGDYLEDWMGSCDLSASERHSRERAVRRHLIPALGHIPLARLHPITIERFFVSRREAGRHQTTEHHLFKFLRAALNRAVRLGLIAANPCEHVEPPRPEPYVPRLWTNEELQRFLAEARRSSRFYPLFLTVLGTGLRAGEVLALMWRNLDLARGVIHVTHVLERPMGRKEYTLREFPKTDHSRRAVRLPAIVLTELMGMKRGLGLIFSRRDGQPLNHHSVVYKDFLRTAERAGVPKMRFHDLRHLHGSLLAAAGVSPKEIQERLGHSSPAFTMPRYIHTPVDLQRVSASLADQWLRLPGEEAGPGPMTGPADTAANHLQISSRVLPIRLEGPFDA